MDPPICNVTVYATALRATAPLAREQRVWWSVETMPPPEHRSPYAPVPGETFQFATGARQTQPLPRWDEPR
jgi:hypothetical protein